MAIIQYNDVICKNTSVYGNNIYIDSGRGGGCGTIWFRTVKGARKALYKNGFREGRDLFDCTKCRCHYSINDKNWKLYPEFACRKAKEEYAKNFKE